MTKRRNRGGARTGARFLTRITSAAAAALLLFCGCTANVRPIKPTEEESAVVGRIGKQEILYDEYRFIVLNCVDDMKEKYGEDLFSGEDAEERKRELEENVLGTVLNSDHAVWEMADFYYYGGAEAMFSEKQITDKVAEFVNETATELGGKKKYLEELENNHMTDRVFRFYTAAEKCASELLYILKNDLGELPSTEEELKEALDSDKLIRTNHVFFEGVTPENKALAAEVREKLLASSDRELEILLLKAQYHCADYTMTTTHGAYFARYSSDYGDKYENAAFALQPGEVSDVIETSDGYYVIIRLEKEPEWILRNFDSLASDVIGSEFNVRLEEFRKAMTFEFTEYGKSLDVTAIR